VTLALYFDHNVDRRIVAIAHRWLRMGQHFAGLVRTPQKGISVGQAIHDLEILAKVMEPEEFIDRIEFLPL
jgi:hypothetical protein